MYIKLYAVLLVFLFFIIGCAKTVVFYDVSETEVDNLIYQLQDMHISDLFRIYPNLKFTNTTNIGDDNISYQFDYFIYENENVEHRGLLVRDKHEYMKVHQYTINVFVNPSGSIYEVLEPIYISESIEINKDNPIQ